MIFQPVFDLDIEFQALRLMSSAKNSPSDVYRLAVDEGMDGVCLENGSRQIASNKSPFAQTGRQ